MPPALAFINPRLSTQNVGDLFIEDSAKRILAFDREHSVDIDPRRPITARDLERINACDAAVILGTNLWRRVMPGAGRWTFTLDQLKQIRVPIVPLGLGTTRHEGDDNGFEPETLAQLRLIHDSCTLASVRDGRTFEALHEAGIRNVAMTGCPTLYRALEPRLVPSISRASSQVVLTVRKGQRHNVRLLAASLARRGLRVIVAAQQDKDTYYSRWIPFVRRRLPTIYEYDLAPYLRLVHDSLGAIGCRLHGNMLHLAHGRPAMFFASCSRAQSFCESFALPSVFCPDHRRLSAAQIEAAVDQFLDPASYQAFPVRYVEHRSEMIRFLDANGLPHRLQTVESRVMSEVA